ncbi:hypothetical protein HK097_003996 [Rhizophlyctis rosea]|uniref:rRNA-processing protein FYV7 n=1 Tax=Rhizophlyctis rosea TaxID=64517 RepID=A0AAD5S1Y5_9FUNG|nr:hypothetical protein HK097_003996 [Rhizophlyctis rosea]
MDVRRKQKQDHIRRTRGAGAAKVSAKKAELGRRTKIKKQFRKILQTESAPSSSSSYLDDTEDIPHFYKPDIPTPPPVDINEIHAAQDFDSDDDNDHQPRNESDIDSEREDSMATAKGAKKSKLEKTLERVQSGRVQKQHTKSSKPNPFAHAASKAAQEKAEKLTAIAEAKRLKEEANQKRKEYYSQRNKTRSKMQQKTRKGQPVMANQISHMLDKIKALS